MLSTIAALLCAAVVVLWSLAACAAGLGCRP